MTERFRRRLAALTCVLAWLALAWPASGGELVIGYLQLKNDERYEETRTYARFLTEPLGRPLPGARVAEGEIRFHGAEAGVTFDVKRRSRKSVKSLLKAIGKLHEEGSRFFVADLPADILVEVAEQTAGMDLLLFNITAREDRLRQEQCQRHVFHVIPSYRMLTDALAQYLAFKRWREVLVLQGPGAGDQDYGAAFASSARRFGLTVVETRPFILSNDPRQRNQNNVQLLTSQDEYDVVFVADTDGEFARDVPYRLALPRPVVGAAGLTGAAWHWAWERHGAPQLESRFEKIAGRPMRDFDWAAWMAVKTIAEAVQRTRSGQFETLRDYLYSASLTLDSMKGGGSNFRPWNNQLRQPLLVVRQNWVVARTPLSGFEHRINDLDTLGVDEPESRCRFNAG